MIEFRKSNNLRHHSHDLQVKIRQIADAATTMPSNLYSEVPFRKRREIFKRMAHSSIMKLDPVSMEKLFYLMLMTFKKQVFLTSSPL